MCSSAIGKCRGRARGHELAVDELGRLVHRAARKQRVEQVGDAPGDAGLPLPSSKTRIASRASASAPRISPNLNEAFAHIVDCQATASRFP